MEALLYSTEHLFEVHCSKCTHLKCKCVRICMKNKNNPSEMVLVEKMKKWRHSHYLVECLTFFENRKYSGPNPQSFSSLNEQMVRTENTKKANENTMHQ